MANSFKPMHNSKHFPIEQLVRVGNYELSKTIGTGNFAIVKLGTHVITKSKVAIKIIDKSRLDEDNLRKTFREIAIMKRLRHPHVVGLYQVMESAHSIYLVTEYVPNGELFDYLTKGRMPEPSASRTFAQIVAAVGYCHASGIVHRDLKAENLLLDKQMNIKLADFGFSNEYTAGSPLSTWCGSPPYAAPELFEGKQYDGPKADIWSLGVVLYVLVCGVLPFDGFTMQELRAVVLAGKFRIPYFLSQDCEHLLRHMLVVEPERRLSLRGVGRHRWLEGTSRDLDISTGGCACHPLPRAAADTRARETALDHMASLPGLTRDEIVQAISEQRYDHITAIYDLLIEKMVSRKQTSARSSLSKEDSMDSTTGQPLDLTSCKNTEDEEEMDAEDSCDASCLVADEGEYCSDAVEKFGSCDTPAPLPPAAPRAATDHARRHTVGPQDCAHKQALELTCAGPPPAALNSASSADGHAAPLYMGFSTSPHVSLLPHTNLAAKLPAVQHQPPRYFSVKDQHLLKPPHAMQQQTSTFGRRASDGGAHVPRGRESASCRSAPTHHVSDSGTPPRSDEQEQTDEQNTEYNSNLSRYMLNRGSSKRHTMATTEDAAHAASANTNNMPSASPSSAANIRTRRTGLLTVTERPPVISPDLVMEVEARMKRNYLPPSIQGGYQYQMDSRYQNSPPQTVPQSPGPSQKGQLKPMLPTIPQGSMMGSTIGNQNTMMGNTIGNQSTMMGNTIGNQSTMMGNTIGNQSTMMGNTIGNQSTMMGNTIGNQSTMMGNTIGNQSTMMGNTIGNQSTMMGSAIGNQSSMMGNTIGNQSSMMGNTIGNQNSMMGNTIGNQNSMMGNTIGNQSTMMGNTIGNQSTMMGNTIGNQSTMMDTSTVNQRMIDTQNQNCQSTMLNQSNLGPLTNQPPLIGNQGSITTGTPVTQAVSPFTPSMVPMSPNHGTILGQNTPGSISSGTLIHKSQGSIITGNPVNNYMASQNLPNYTHHGSKSIGSLYSGSIVQGTPNARSTAKQRKSDAGAMYGHTKGSITAGTPNMQGGPIMSGTPNNQVLQHMMSAVHIGSTNTGSIMSGTPNINQSNQGPFMSGTPIRDQSMVGMPVGSTNTGSIMSGTPNIQNSGPMMTRTPNVMQNSGSIMSGTPNMLGMQIGSTNTGSIMSGTPNTNHMRSGISNPSYMMQGSANMMQGTPNMMQGSPNMMQAAPNMMQGTPNMMQGPTNIMQGSSNMIQATNMMQGSPNMMQGTPNMMQGPTNMMQGTQNMMQGPTNMMQSSSNMMPSKNIMQGSPNVTQGPSNMLHSGSMNDYEGIQIGSSGSMGSVQGPPAQYNARQRKYSGPQRVKHQMLATVQEMAREHTERYSPVRRASESSPPRGAHDIASARLEYQQLQRGLDRRSTSAVPGASPPIAEPRSASASAPGSPRRVTIPLGSVELPPLSCEATRALLRAANTLGAADDDATTQHITQELATKLGINVRALHLPNVNPSQEVLRCLHNYNNSHFSNPASPCSPHHQVRSPLHQITEGLSFLHTGSITRGTVGAAAPLSLLHNRSSNNSPTCGAPEPLHMIQEEIGNGFVGDNKPFQTHPQISLTDCLGSEVTLVASSSEDSMDSLENHAKYPLPQFVISEPSDLEHRPSITKGIGRRVSQETERDFEIDAEMTPRDDETNPALDTYPRRGSDKSLGYSDDSLSNDSATVSPHTDHNVAAMYSHLVSASSGFSENRGSFSEHRESFSFSDRGSISERGDYGRSSLSERSDLGRSSFSERGETPRSSFSAQGLLGEVREYYEDVYMPRDTSRHCLDACLEEAPEKFQIVQSPVAVSLAQECYEVALSSDCSQLDSRRIFELVRQAIAASQVPPNSINVSDEDEGLAPGLLCLEYSDGIQIELVLREEQGQVRKVMKMRRVSGDQLAYGNLCHQLIHSLT